jgi:hypothetical protein
VPDFFGLQSTKLKRKLSTGLRCDPIDNIEGAMCSMYATAKKIPAFECREGIVRTNPSLGKQMSAKLFALKNKYLFYL